MPTLNSATSFLSNPFEAQYQGQTVLVISTGDMEGQSPTYLTIDQHGASKWVPIRDVTVTDMELLRSVKQRQPVTAGSR